MYSKTDFKMDATVAHIWKYKNIEQAEESLDGLEKEPLVINSFVGGDWAANEADQWIDAYNPKSGKIFAKIPKSSAKDVDSAVQAAEKAFKSWSKTSRAKRSQYLHRIAALILENRELLAVWESIDQGKTVQRARIEVDRAATNFT